MAFLHKTDHCRVCGNQKTVEVVRIDENNVVQGTKECDPNTWRTFHINVANEAIMRVFCSNCGITYHEDSI